MRVQRVLAGLLAAVVLAGCGPGATVESGTEAGRGERVLGRSSPAAGGLRFPVLFRRATGRWYYLDRFDAGGPVGDQQFFYGGDPSDLPVVGDWTGSGTLRVGVYRRSTGRWYLLEGWDGSGPTVDSKFTYGGHPTDIPMVGDFNGDGIADPALYRPVTQTWYLLTQRGAGGPVGDLQVPFPAPVSALPVVGDFDGDGRSDLATFHVPTGTWRLDTNRDGTPEATFVYGGAPLDRPLAGDLDGDGDDDPILYRASTGEWFALTQWSAAGPQADLKFRYGGDPTDFAVVGDWDGDGADEPGLYRVATGRWFLVTEMAGGAPSADIKMTYGGDGTDLPATQAPVLLAGAAPSWGGLAFRQPRITSPVAWADTLAVGDVDGDGLLDALVPNFVFELALLRGNGDGTFRPRELTGVAGTVGGALADVNADGALDALGWTGSTVEVALGGGNGTFGLVSTVGPGASRAVIAEATGDGRPDVVFTRGSAGTVTVVPGNGDGTFGTGTAYSTLLDSSPLPNAVAVADVDADGRADLVVGNAGRKQVVALRGQAAGGFGAPVRLVPEDVPCAALVSGDFNEDGRPDFAAQGDVPASPQTLSILLSGAGGYTRAAVLAAGEGPGQLTVADVNADGHQDVVTGGESSFSISLGRGDGTFDVRPWVGSDVEAESVGVGDFDRDGRQDFLVATGSTQLLAFHQGDGAGGARGAQDKMLGVTPRALEVADLDGDGRQDVVVADPAALADGTYGLSYAYRQPDGSLGPAQRLVTPNYGWIRVAARDLNRDGRMDLVALGSQRVQTFLRGVNGTYALRYSLSVSGLNPTSMVAEDLDGNGVVDVAYCYDFDGTDRCRVLPGLGNGDLGTSIAASAGGDQMLAVDADLDGRLELAWSQPGGGMKLGAQSGALQYTVVETLSSGDQGSLGVGGMASGDLNRDGYPEVVWTDLARRLVVQHVALDRRRQIYDLSDEDQPRGVVVQDLDGDGVLDVAATSYERTMIFRGRGDGRVDLVTRLVPVAYASLLAVIREPSGAPTLLEGTVNSRVRLQVRD